MDRARREEILRWSNAAATYEKWLEVIGVNRPELMKDTPLMLGLISTAAQRWFAKDGRVDAGAVADTIAADLGIELV